MCRVVVYRCRLMVTLHPEAEDSIQACYLGLKKGGFILGLKKGGKKNIQFDRINVPGKNNIETLNDQTELEMKLGKDTG